MNHHIQHSTDPTPKDATLFQLFITFAKIGSITFGGGYAMLPILERELVGKRGWTTEEDLTDYFAIGQCTPGIIAVNTATFIGNCKRGYWGGIAATLGVVFPSLVIIIVIASLLQGFAEFKIVKDAFAGIRAIVCVLIFNSALKLLKSAVKDSLTAIIFALVFLSTIFFDLSPIWFVLFSALAGLLIQSRKGGQ